MNEHRMVHEWSCDTKKMLKYLLWDKYYIDILKDQF